MDRKATSRALPISEGGERGLRRCRELDGSEGVRYGEAKLFEHVLDRFLQRYLNSRTDRAIGKRDNFGSKIQTREAGCLGEAARHSRQLLARALEHRLASKQLFGSLGPSTEGGARVRSLSRGTDEVWIR